MKLIQAKHLLFALSTLCATAVAAVAGGERWETDYKAALKQAQAENKLLLLDFTGSDWCPPCMMLNQQVFAKDAFYESVDDQYVLVELDFPRRKEIPAELQKQNRDLAVKYGVEYFPTLLLITPDETVLDKTVGMPRGGLDGVTEWMAEAYSKQ